MNKSKFFALAFVGLFAMTSFMACGNDDEPEIRYVEKKDTVTVVKKDTLVAAENNWSRYQALVTADVKDKKKHDKVILLVAFGCTWEQGFNAFDATIEAYRKDARFKDDYDVFLSYSSAICINRAAAGENGVTRNYYAPPFWLNAFADKDVMYSESVVQSLQVIPGEEYTRVINYIKDFANNANGDLDDDYLAGVTLRLGVPLLQSKEEDVPAVAKELNELFKTQAADGVVAFMGHGNPDEYDTYKANIRYTELEKALQTYSKSYFVGTVDMMENFKTNVYARMQAAGFTSGKVYCVPLMSIDGDHGHNDMAGDDDDNWEEGVGFTPNDEGEVEDTSWKMYFQHLGYTCDNSTMIEKGLLELPSIRNIWMNHTEAAINGEPLDYYHSKNPE